MPPQLSLEMGSWISKTRPQLMGRFKTLGNMGCLLSHSLASLDPGLPGKEIKGQVSNKNWLPLLPTLPLPGFVGLDLLRFRNRVCPSNLQGLRRNPGGRTKWRGGHQLSPLPWGQKDRHWRSLAWPRLGIRTGESAGCGAKWTSLGSSNEVEVFPSPRQHIQVVAGIPSLPTEPINTAGHGCLGPAPTLATLDRFTQSAAGGSTCTSCRAARAVRALSESVRAWHLLESGGRAGFLPGCREMGEGQERNKVCRLLGVGLAPSGGLAT